MTHGELIGRLARGELSPKEAANIIYKHHERIYNIRRMYYTTGMIFLSLWLVLCWFGILLGGFIHVLPILAVIVSVVGLMKTIDREYEDEDKWFI